MSNEIEHICCTNCVMFCTEATPWVGWCLVDGIRHLYDHECHFHISVDRLIDEGSRKEK